MRLLFLVRKVIINNLPTTEGIVIFTEGSKFGRKNTLMLLTYNL